MNLDAIVSDMEAQQKFDSDFLTLKQGDNRVRIISDFVKVEKIYQGKFPNSKYQGILIAGQKLRPDETVKTEGWAWVINRETGELKIGAFGKGILTALVSFKNDPEYAYKSFPMPYDITIKNTGDGPNRYSVVPARTNTEVTAEEMEKLNKKKKISDIVALIIEKQNKPAEATKPVDYPENEISPDDIFPDSSV